MPCCRSGEQKVLRAVMHADVRTLDPFWTTQTIAGIHAMLIYDTLYGNDDDMRPHPQMVEKHEISPDKLTYVFTLRAGLPDIRVYDSHYTADAALGLASATGPAFRLTGTPLAGTPPAAVFPARFPGERMLYLYPASVAN